MKLADASNEQDSIESVRNIFRAYVPESDSWAEPNFFSINAIVIGGLAWSAINEVRNGIDKRMSPQTAVGEHLDVLVSQPPLSMTRRSATKAEGFISVELEDITTVPAGYVFEAANGVRFIATETVDLVDGKAVIGVESVGSGADNNSPDNQPLSAKDGVAYSMGVYGAYNTECDEQLRRRFYAEKSKCHFFGSQCSMQDAIAGMDGVTRSWVVQDGLTVKILVLMEDKYPCGIIRDEDREAIKNYFNDECLSSMFFCPIFESPEPMDFAPEITWGNGMPDLCEVTAEMTEWLRANYDLGESVHGNQIQTWLDNNYGEYQPTTECCDYPAKCMQIYNCVELVGCDS